MGQASMVQFLWRYLVYADEQLLAAAASVPAEGWDRELGISVGSVRKLVEHSIDAQARWLVRIGGPQLPMAAGLPREQLAGIWSNLHQALLRFAAEQDDASTLSIVHGRDKAGDPFAMPLWACMLHVADHATYHRGQLNSAIKLAGGTPSEVMLFTFAKQGGGSA